MTNYSDIKYPAAAASTTTYADMPALVAATGMSIGDQALVTALNKLFMYTGSGWFLIATMTNGSPTAITGVNGTYTLATDGAATTITAVSADPEGFALTWSYAVTTGSLGSTATVSQTDNVFTITPSTDSANAGTFGITFSVTDGSTGAVNAVSAFTLEFGTWTAPQYASIVPRPSYAASGDKYGRFFDISGDGTFLAVGYTNSANPALSLTDQGEVIVHKNTSGTWSQDASFESPSPSASSSFGWGVALDYYGNTLAAFHFGTTKALRIFTRSGSTWTLQHTFTGNYPTLPSGNLPPENTMIWSGYGGSSFADDGNTLVCGGYGGAVGQTAILTRSGTTWTHEVTFVHSDWATSDGTTGAQISGDGLTIVTSSYNHAADSKSASGALYVYEYNGTSWSSTIAAGHQAKLIHSDGDETGDQLGRSDNAEGSFSVSYDGNYIVAGAAPAQLGGGAYVFLRTGTSWSQQAVLRPADFTSSTGGTRFGRSCAISKDGDKIAVGAPDENSLISSYTGSQSGISSEGAVYMFLRSGTSWTEESRIKLPTTNTNAAANAEFGIMVKMSANGFLVAGSAWRQRDTDGGDQKGQIHIYKEGT